MKLNESAINLARAKRCMTVTELTQSAGISGASLRNGYKRSLGAALIGRIAVALDVDVETIIVQEGE
ncbi:MAG: hypothetical protein RSD65_06265 [Anaerovoracaceae bacterium]